MASGTPLLYIFGRTSAGSHPKVTLERSSFDLYGLISSRNQLTKHLLPPLVPRSGGVTSGGPGMKFMTSWSTPLNGSQWTQGTSSVPLTAFWRENYQAIASSGSNFRQ